jgi:transcriptional regulator with XRE-family HTH domain
LSQLALASDSAVSTRYLSFIETGRARPSREMVTHLAEQLDVPPRERNALLLAAGYAPVLRERSLDDPAMQPVREAITRFVSAHEPYPAVVVDAHWNLLAANAAVRVFTEGLAPMLLQPSPNALRMALHPLGLAPRILNFAEWSGHLMQRLRRQVAVSGDPELQALYEELRGYPGVLVDPPARDAATPSDPVLLHRFTLDRAGDELSLFSTVTTFGTPSDITLAELTIEAFYPADDQTRAALQSLAATAPRSSTADPFLS